MGIRLGNMDRWQVLKDGEGIGFPGIERTIAIEVNAPGEVQLWITEADYPEPEVFLALVKGRDRVEFSVLGDFTLVSAGGDCWFYTADGQQTANVDVAPIVFTRIANRKARNPNLEMMEYRMNLNMQRRLLEMEEEGRRRIEDLERRYVAQRSTRTPPALVGKEPEQISPTAEEAERAEDAVREGTKDAPKGAKDSKPPRKREAAAGASDD